MQINMRAAARKLFYWTLTVSPFILLTLALAGGFVRLDPDNRWGTQRVGLLLLGLMGSAAVLSVRLLPKLDRWLSAKARRSERGGAGIDGSAKGSGPSQLSGQPEGGPPGSRPAGRPPSKPSPQPGRRFSPRGLSLPDHRLLVASFFLVLLAIEMTYVFLVSSGHWTKWPSTTAYYDLLGQALAHGRVALPVEPSPVLASLADPYNALTRPNVSILYDASYYHGKYFLYWGPAPAAFIALVKFITPMTVGDNIVTFIAVNLILLFSVLSLIHIKRRYYESLPPWLLLASVFMVATFHPMLWVLDYPTIYPSAIASGAAFLMGGVYLSLPILAGEVHVSPWRYLLAGLFLMLAFASRLLLALPVAVLGGWTLYQLARQHREMGFSRERLTKAVALMVPLALGMALLGAYNYARFGDVFETGLKYQLNYGDMRLIVNSGSMFNLRYLLPNAFYYLFGPLRFLGAFPFVKPLREPLPLLSKALHPLALPAAYHLEYVSGVVFTSPMVAFSAVFARRLLSGVRIRRDRQPAKPSNSSVTSRPALPKPFYVAFTPVMLAGLASALPTFVYFWVTNRFLLDWMPLVALLSIVGMWHFYHQSQDGPASHVYATVVPLLLMLTGYVIALLLALTGLWSNFDDLNPVLWHTLSTLFPH